MAISSVGRKGAKGDIHSISSCQSYNSLWHQKSECFKRLSRTKVFSEDILWSLGWNFLDMCRYYQSLAFERIPKFGNT